MHVGEGFGEGYMDKVLEAGTVVSDALQEGTFPRTDVALHTQGHTAALVFRGGGKILRDHLLVLARPYAHLPLPEPIRPQLFI
jgi:hypothetical protein